MNPLPPTTPPPLVIAHASTNKANALAARSILIGWGFEGVAFKTEGNVHKVKKTKKSNIASPTLIFDGKPLPKHSLGI